MKNKWLARGAVSALVLLSATSALSLTGEEVLNKLSYEEQKGYVIGVVHTLAYTESQSGEQEKGSCILRWYVEERGAEQVNAMLQRMKEVQAIPIIARLAERACGE